MLGLQRNEEAAVIGRRIGAAGADGAVDVFDRGIGLQQRCQRALPRHHGVERRIGRGLGDADQKAGVLLRKEALRHDGVEHYGAGQRQQRDA